MIADFVLRLVAGIALMWLLMPRGIVADGFFRIQMLVVLGLGVLLILSFQSAIDQHDSRYAGFSAEQSAALAGKSRLLQQLIFASAAAAYPGHVFWKLGRRKAGTACILTIGLTSLAALTVNAASGRSGSLLYQQLFAEFSSAAVLGATLTGMLLGHWYLTTPTMSLKPLIWFCRVLFLAAVLRGIASATAWIHPPVEPLQQLQWMWLSLRIGGAVVAPAAAAIMSLTILRHRNTQSTTGVLFACLILVFMGEMSAALLQQDLGIPL